MSAGLRAWGPALACAALIFAASSRPTLPVPLETGWDKIAHFSAYAVFGLALGRGRAHSGWPLGAALLAGLAYAASDELHQGLVPGRVPDVADWVADAFGTLAGLLVHHRWHRARPAPREPLGGTPVRSPSP